MRKGTIVWLVATGLILCSAIALGDRPVAENEVPKVVMDAVQTVLPKAEFLNGELDDQHHKPPIYELDVRLGEEISHIHVTVDGKVTRLLKGFMREGPFPTDKLPTAVLKTLKKLRPEPKILEVEVGRYGHNRFLYKIRVKSEEGGAEEFFITRDGEEIKAEDHRRK